MLRDLKKLLTQNKIAGILSVIFCTLLIWWLLIRVQIVSIFSLSFLPNESVWTLVYQVLALIGGVSGLYLSRSWGGYKSLIGRSTILLASGLLCQVLGQTLYSYYYVVKEISIPYPSMGDFGYFTTIPLYIYGAFLLAKTAGIRFTLINLSNKILVLLVPACLLLISYMLFLSNYDFSGSNYAKTFLDFAYPLGNVIYVSIAILSLVLSKDLLGGTLKKPIQFLLFVFVIHYFSDFVFLYQVSRGTWYAGGFSDLLYSLSYFSMSVAILYIGLSAGKIDIFLKHSLKAKLDSVSNLFSLMVENIIKSQERIIGPLAWAEASKVSGLKIISHQNDGIIFTDHEKNVIDALVYRYEKLFGYMSSRVSYEAVRNLMVNLSHDQVPASLARNFEDGILVNRKYFNKISEDLYKQSAELVLANEKLKDLEEFRSDFISLATHHMGTPLTAVRGYLSLLKEGMFNKLPDKEGEVLDATKTLVDRLSNVVRNFSDINSFETSQISLDYSQISLIEVVSQVKQHFQNQSKIKYDINLVNNPLVYLDKSKLLKAVSNVVDNALKYSTENEVLIKILSADNGFRIKIIDRCTRILPDVKSSLLKKLSQRGSTIESNIIASDLGLFTAKQYVEAHHGEMFVEVNNDTTSFVMNFVSNPHFLEVGDNSSAQA